jgi:HlyD family secretion protein
MSTTVEILTETRNNVLSVPIQAVTTRSDSVSTGAKGFEEVAEASVELDKEEVASVKTNLNEIVFITSGDTAKMVQVKTGIQNNAYIEITSGLSGDEEVIVAPYSAISRKLQNGKLVQKTKKEDLFKENK